MAVIIGQVAAARREHDGGKCPYGGTAIEVHFHPFDGTRLDLDDGEDLAGLTVRLRDKQTPGVFRVYCDIELGGQGPGRRAVIRREYELV